MGSDPGKNGGSVFWCIVDCLSLRAQDDRSHVCLLISVHLISSLYGTFGSLAFNLALGVSARMGHGTSYVPSTLHGDPSPSSWSRYGDAH
eukprot:4912094-Pyramimonas_sp.AAC.1